MTTDLVIPVEKGVPIPTARRVIASVYPFDKMEIGDSFFVATNNKKGRNSSIASAAYLHAKQLGRKFTTRTVEGGMRVWRLQ